MAIILYQYLNIVSHSDGMNIYAYDKRNSKNITDLMDCFWNEDFDVTDEFGLPLEGYYYEVTAHDIDNDNKKEIIFLAGDKKEKLVVCV